MIKRRGWLGIPLLLLATGAAGCKCFGSDANGVSQRERMWPGSSSNNVAAQSRPKESRPKDLDSDRDPTDARIGRLSTTWGTLRRHDPHESQAATDLAVNAYQDALQLDPSRTDAHWRLAILSDQLGRVEESETHFRKALAKEPNNSNLHADYGYSLSLRGLLDEAEAELQKALKTDPNNRRAHYHLGLVLAAQHQPKEALTEFRKAGCSRAEAHANLHEVESLHANRGPQLPEPIEQADLTYAEDSDSTEMSSTLRIRRVCPVLFGKRPGKD